MKITGDSAMIISGKKAAAGIDLSQYEIEFMDAVINDKPDYVFNMTANNNEKDDGEYMFRRRKMKKALFSLLISLVLTGCGDSAFPEITDEAIAFKTEKYFFEGSSNDVNYYCFEYNGRKYVQYGTMRALPKKKDIPLPKHVDPSKWYEEFWK